QVRGHEVHVVGKVLPGSGDAFDVRLTAEDSLRADFTCHTGDFIRERSKLIDHGVHRVFQLEDFALCIDCDLLRKVAGSNRGGDLGDVSDLGRQVRCEGVDVVGEVFPGSGDAFDV